MPKGARKNDDDTIGVLDFETDPFLFGRIPYPFAACIYFSENDYCVLWDADSKSDFIGRCVAALRRLPECTLYAHNGGRFDFRYLTEFCNTGAIEIRNNRITKMRIGKVTLKDSFPLMPFALAEFKKEKIDYDIFKKHRRNAARNRSRIRDYLVSDCRYLRDLLLGFRATIGSKDTIGAAAFLQMRTRGLEIQSLNEVHDEQFRQFYFGGRVQAFQKGIHNGAFKFLDINSAYPFAMLKRHSHGAEYAHTRRLPSLRNIGQRFLRIRARSAGALPLRANDGTLHFPDDGREREFCATGWEIAAGIETKTLDVTRVIDVWTPQSFICFRDYVQTFFALRQRAKREGDDVKRLAYKYLLNSGYGKFAQNPRDFKEYQIAHYGKNVPGFNWETDFGELSLWSRSSYKGWGFFDVATGASITGYVRAMLWRAICASKGVLYADTDSLICRSSRAPMGDQLGQWKLEHAPDVRVTQARIAGKKLYGVRWSRPDAHGNRYKIASKGARLTWGDMGQLCKGRSIIWSNDAPTFSLPGAHFITRHIRAT